KLDRISEVTSIGVFWQGASTRKAGAFDANKAMSHSPFGAKLLYRLGREPPLLVGGVLRAPCRCVDGRASHAASPPISTTTTTTSSLRNRSLHSLRSRSLHSLRSRDGSRDNRCSRSHGDSRRSLCGRDGSLCGNRGSRGSRVGQVVRR